MSRMRMPNLSEATAMLEAKAEEVAATLSAMANPKRLLVMCTVIGAAAGACLLGSLRLALGC